jgi:hypothetical protein
MKAWLLLFFIFVSFAAEGQTLFINLGPGDKSQKTLQLMSRMSVYSLMCDRAQAGRFSEKYRALFTEKSGGMVMFEGETFRNPIEKMRNIAMLNFIQTMNQYGLNGTCEMYIDQYDFLINKTPEQLAEYAESAD